MEPKDEDMIGMGIEDPSYVEKATSPQETLSEMLSSNRIVLKDIISKLDDVLLAIAGRQILGGDDPIGATNNIKSEIEAHRGYISIIESLANQIYREIGEVRPFGEVEE